MHGSELDSEEADPWRLAPCAPRSAGADAILCEMAGPLASRYASDTLIPALARGARTKDAQASIQVALADPYRFLRVFFHSYAFSRRGKDRLELSSIALEALDRTCEARGIDAFLSESDASSLWVHFQAVCGERRRKSMEQLNIGVVAGVAELAQELQKSGAPGSIATWLVDLVKRTGRLEPAFERMVDIRGVGPKLCSTLMRDIAFLFELEPMIDHVDRLYVQPIDRWLRQAAPYVVEDLADAQAADWVLAGKLAKAARRAGVSGIRFNMGVNEFGLRVSRTPRGFELGMEAILSRATVM